MDQGDQKIRIEAPTPRASLVTPSESQPSPLDPLSAATSTLFTSSPIQQNAPLLATNVGNHASDAHAELNQQAYDYEAIDPYVVSLAQQRKQLGNPKTHDLWIVATRIFFPQIYLHFSLRLPGLYWARVDRIFRDAAQAIEELKAQLDQGSLKNDTVDDAASAQGINHQINLQTRRTPQRSNTIYSYNDQTEGPDDTVIGMKLVSEDGITKLKRSWGLFIDSLLREWKTLNLVSVLLLSAVIAILQVDAVSADFAIRTPALGSAICALMSLLYGCIYTIRFFDMKKVHRAMMWSQKAQQSASNQYWNQYWNPWVFLSLPVVWLTWSIMLFTTAIMTYVWRTDGRSGEDYQPISPHLILASRLVLTAIFAIGLVHLFLVIWTLVEWDYAKLDNNFRATVNKNKGEANKMTLVNTGMNLHHTGGTLTTDPLSYSSGSPLTNAEASIPSGGRSSTPTNESQTIYMSGPAGGSTLALPTIPILSTRLGTFFLSFIPTAWLNDNRTHNLGRLVDPNRTTAQTPRPVATGNSTSVLRPSLPASLARRVSRVRTPVPEPTIPEETQAAEAFAPMFPPRKINNEGATSGSAQMIVHPVDLEISSRSIHEQDTPPDSKPEEEGDYDKQLKDLGATAVSDLTRASKSKLVNIGPPQPEATHTKSTVVPKAQSDDSVAHIAIQDVTDIREMGTSLPELSRVHETTPEEEISQSLKATESDDSVAHAIIQNVTNIPSFGEIGSPEPEPSLPEADLLQVHGILPEVDVESGCEDISTASTTFDESPLPPGGASPTELATSTTSANKKYLAEQRASLISRHSERAILRSYHLYQLYENGQIPDIPPELVDDTPGTMEAFLDLYGAYMNEHQGDGWLNLLLPRDEIRDPALDVPILQDDNVLTQSPEKAVLPTESKTRPDDITWTKARKEFYSLSKLPHEEMVGPILPQVLAGDSEQTHNGFVHPPIYLKNEKGTFGLPFEQAEWSQILMLPEEGYFIIQWPTISLPSLPNQVTYLLNDPFPSLAQYYPWVMAPFESTTEGPGRCLATLLSEPITGTKPQGFNKVDLCWQWPDCTFLTDDFLLVSLHHIGFASDGKEVWQPQFRLANPVPTFWSKRDPIASLQRGFDTILGDELPDSVPIELPKESSISADGVPYSYYSSRELVNSGSMTHVSSCLPQICNVPVSLRRKQTRLSVPLFFKDENGKYGVPLSQIQLPQPMPSGYIIISLPYFEGVGPSWEDPHQIDTEMREFPLRDLVPWGNAPCDWLPPQIRSNPNISTAIQNLFNTIYEKVNHPISHPDGSRITASDLKIFSLHHVGYISGRWQVWQPDFVLPTELASGKNFMMWRAPEVQYIREKQNGPEEVAEEW